MGRPREFDSAEAMQTIKEVFWSRGYEATSISDLEAATGLARPRLYAAFGSKQDMLYRSIDTYLASDIERILLQVDSGGIEAIAGWFRRFAVIREERPERALMGCLMVNSMVEFGDEDDQVMALRDRYIGRIEQAFRSALESSAAKAELDGEVDSRVDMATLLLWGLFVTVRSGMDLEEVRRKSAAAAAEVESWRRH